jgi:hypothetical protein
MADIKYFPKKFSDVVQFDLNKNYTRENATLLKGNKYSLGDIVAQNAQGKIVPIDVSKEDGTQNFYGVFLSEDIDLTDEQEDKVVYGAILRNGPASVLENGLNYQTDEEEKKKTIKAAMEAAGIRVDVASI